MRWNSAHDPECGDIRHRTAFLWWPRCIDNEWRWWERATWTEKWFGYLGCWREMSFQPRLRVIRRFESVPQPPPVLDDRWWDQPAWARDWSEWRAAVEEIASALGEPSPFPPPLPTANRIMARVSGASVSEATMAMKMLCQLHKSPPGMPVAILRDA